MLSFWATILRLGNSVPSGIISTPRVTEWPTSISGNSEIAKNGSISVARFNVFLSSSFIVSITFFNNSETFTITGVFINLSIIQFTTLSKSDSQISHIYFWFPIAVTTLLSDINNIMEPSNAALSWFFISFSFVTINFASSSVTDSTIVASNDNWTSV